MYEVEVPDDYDAIAQEDSTDAFSFSSSMWGTNPEGLSGYSGGTGQ